MTLYLLMSAWHKRFLNEVALGAVTTVSGNAFHYTMPLGASNKNRIAQTFAQLLTMTTCVCLLVESANWKSMSKSTQPDYKQFYNTAKGQLLFYAARDYQGSEWSVSDGRAD